MIIIRLFFFSIISFGLETETSQRDVLRIQNILRYDRQIIKKIMNRSYSLNVVCPKIISNKQEFWKIKVQILEFLLYEFLMVIYIV